VQAADAARAVVSVEARVGFPVAAGRARFGTRAPYEADDQVADGEAAALRGVRHPADRLVAKYQSVCADRSRAEPVLDDLSIGPADPCQQPVDQQRAQPGGRSRRVVAAVCGRPGTTVIAAIGFTIRPVSAKMTCSAVDASMPHCYAIKRS